ncbi:MAG: hypothetical protein ACFB6R_07165 [Alphaproteobacteria bacterium]
MNKIVRSTATALGLAVALGALGACASLSEEDQAFLQQARNDARSAADQSARSASTAEDAARRAEAAAARAEESAARAEAIFNRTLRK